MPVDIQLKLFDTLVIPIMTYGAKVWGFEHLNMLDQLELQFLKLVMNVRRSIPKCMMYGELGRLPVSITIKLRMAGFWGKMLTGKQEKLSYNLYQMLLSDWVNVKWISKIKNILDESGLSYIWDMQYVHCATLLLMRRADVLLRALNYASKQCSFESVSSFQSSIFIVLHIYLYQTNGLMNLLNKTCIKSHSNA